MQAILAGAISSSDAAGVRRTVQETITRLQKTSPNRHSLGHRYARSLRLFWRKLFGSKQTREGVTGRDSSTPRYLASFVQHSADAIPNTGAGEGGHNLTNWDSLNSFSWRDLDSLGQFIENDILTGTTDGLLGTPEFISDRSPVVRDISQAGFWNERDFVF